MPRGRRIATAAAVLLVLSALTAGPAGALPPGRSGLYGGGAVRDYMQFVSLRVLPAGTLTAHATLVTKCSPRFGDQLTESISVRDVRLDSAGRYGATSSFSDRADPGVPLTGGMFVEGTITFSARVLAGGLARGTARVRTTYSRTEGGPVVSRCDTGRIAWSALRPPGDTGTGRSTLQPGTHRGTTDQDEPFLMRVTDRGRLVRRAGVTARWTAPARSGCRWTWWPSGCGCGEAGSARPEPSRGRTPTPTAKRWSSATGGRCAAASGGAARAARSS